ncbi:acetyl-CoA carboxylase biotin carboxyl carrier protein subunit [Saccharopolyspora indica]|uniref:acetyl-CoA carboxylase biotin carboxyl carrier protein n=1 Tax=Saccharopolyspora indica TaxID=1229659 RepID=UPI0022EAE5FB|nr:acetyl-CoA carboxylase biotin carboxyl carrier protein subunit [Saccharopolyspora indica]MDA3648378.1 acetyl-CoA carboxylase biotin carboxyl carrier protein subunit [Saccharopolyspora indica]
MSVTSVNGNQNRINGIADLDEVAGVLRQHVHALAERSSRAPASVRLSARGVELEISWPDSAQPAAGPPVPVPAVELPSTTETSAASTFPLCAATVGVFYRAPEPGAKPFVSEGDTIRPGQQVAIIEAMKLMIPVEADRAGTVLEVLVADGESVEHGQPLLTLGPAEGAAR